MNNATPHPIPEQLAELGWKLFPLKGSGDNPKSPQIKGWQDRATDDIDQLTTWAREFPDCWWGALTGITFDVLDIDNMEVWETADPLLTPTQSTPSGGVHYLLTHKSNNLGRKAYLGDEYVGDYCRLGFYIAVEPSPGYEFLDDPIPPFANLPSSIHLRQAAVVTLEPSEPVPGGRRHD